MFWRRPPTLLALSGSMPSLSRCPITGLPLSQTWTLLLQVVVGEKLSGPSRGRSKRGARPRLELGRLANTDDGEGERGRGAGPTRGEVESPFWPCAGARPDMASLQPVEVKEARGRRRHGQMPCVVFCHGLEESPLGVAKLENKRRVLAPYGSDCAPQAALAACSGGFRRVGHSACPGQSCVS